MKAKKINGELVVPFGEVLELNAKYVDSQREISRLKKLLALAGNVDIHSINASMEERK